MHEISIVRTLPIIATEINAIKDQTRKLILCSSIEIGRRLSEAKAMLPHGEWGNWLKESVDYSQSTANNLMNIFDKYGSQQISMFGDNAKSQAIGNLSYTQAVALLGVPDESREQFIEENNVAEMSTRELQAAIKQLKEAQERAQKAEERAGKETARADQLAASLEEAKEKAAAVEDIEEENKELREANKKLAAERTQSQKEIEKIHEQLKRAKESGDDTEKVRKLEESLQQAQDKVAELTQKINEPVTIEPAIIEKIPDEVEKELEELRAEVAQSKSKPVISEIEAAKLKFSIHFEEMKNGVRNLISALDETKTDPETYQKYQGATIKFLNKIIENVS